MPDDPYYEFFVDLLQESDRASVVLGAAKLDLTLGEILVRALSPCPDADDRLLDNDGPLSTFSARIDMVFRLGLIDRQFARHLHLIRKIRNDFAHETKGASLDASPHRDRVRELASPYNKWFDWDALLRKGKEAYGVGLSLSSFKCRMVLGLAIMSLETVRDTCVPIHSASPATLVNVKTDRPGNHGL